MRVLLYLFVFLPGWITAQDNASWRPFVFGKPSLTVQLPGIPSLQKTNLPPDVKAFITDYEAFYLRDEPDGLVVTMMYAFYANDVVADAKGAVEGTNSQWQGTGSKVVVSSTTENKISNKSSVQQRGKLVQGGKEYDYMDIVVVEGSKLWQVIVMVESKQESLQQTLRKIIDSISFK